MSPEQPPRFQQEHSEPLMKGLHEWMEARLAELNGANAFDYLTELLRHTEELKQNPSEWMPRNWRETVERLATQVAA